MAEPTVYETNRRATALGLSFAQMKAWQWLPLNGPAKRNDWRSADIQTRTMNSLERRGLIEWRKLDDSAPGQGYRWALTEAGRTALGVALPDGGQSNA